MKYCILHLNFNFRPHELAEHFVKLIEEPHHAKTMLVLSAEKAEIAEDHTKILRAKLGIDGVYEAYVKKAGDSI